MWREALQPNQSMHNSRTIAAGSAPAVIPIVIRFGRLGDMVLLSPLLNLLHRRYHNPCWLIGSGPWSAQLYRRHENVARIWSISVHAVFDAWRSLPVRSKAFPDLKGESC